VDAIKVATTGGVNSKIGIGLGKQLFGGHGQLRRPAGHFGDRWLDRAEQERRHDRGGKAAHCRTSNRWARSAL
jgi:hypothetical protein